LQDPAHPFGFLYKPAMDDFLANIGPEFDPTFVKFHVGTDDLEELLEFTWERSDLAPLVDAGLKPLFRNKLFRAILEEKAARASVMGSDVQTLPVDNKPVLESPTAVPTAAPSAASMSEIEDNEDASSAMSVPVDSASETHRVPVASPNTTDSMAAFPPLGVPNNRRSVPQAKHNAITPSTQTVSPYRVDEREARRLARASQVVQPVGNRDVSATGREQRTQRIPQRIAQRNLPRQARVPQASLPGYGRQFGSYQPMSSAYQSSYGAGAFLGCARSCTICYPTG